MNFFKKIFGGTNEATPAYSNFEEGDIFYFIQNSKYHFFKALKVDNEHNVVHILIYEEMYEMPLTNQIGQFKIRVYHAPIDKNGFTDLQLFYKTQVEDADLLGYHEYIKQTRNIDELVSYATKYFKEAYLLSDQKKHHKAINKYSLAIYLLPNYFEAIDNRAFSKMDLGMFSEAIDDFNLSLSTNPGGFAAVFSIGECYLKLGDFQNAKTYFEKALEINPNYDKTKDYLNLTLHLMNQ